MKLIEQYLEYISNIRRYSMRTRLIYSDVLYSFLEFAFQDDKERQSVTDSDFTDALRAEVVRGYEMYLLESKKLSSRTVNLHISALSGLCRYLVKEKIIDSNPVSIISRPKENKRLPAFYKKDNIDLYFAESRIFAFTDPNIGPDEFIRLYLKEKERPGYSQERDMTLVTMLSLAEKPEKFAEWLYGKRLKRVIVSTLYSTGIRRSELISLTLGSLDFSRKQLKVKGKGDKTREIPVIESLCKEISLYLQAVDTTECGRRGYDSPLFVTFRGKHLYPVYVDRAVKSELGETGVFTERKSPHVLRHTLATELLDEGADINSIKELLGHSSLAATQVYTHNSVAKLKKVYKNAHPRAKSGGRHGD